VEPVLTSPVTRWWADHRGDLSDPATAARIVLAARADGLLDLPPPGGGATALRWSALAALAAADVTLAKLGEAHADAVAILADLGGSLPADALPADVLPTDVLWAVWAARTPLLTASRGPDARWRLDGVKPYASGYGPCARALVSAAAPDGDRLFAVDTADAGVVADEGSWPGLGMAGTRSLTLTLTGVPAVAVGGPGAYTARPGFWWGAIGIAACWYGGAVGVAAPLYERAAAAPADPYRAAHLGAVHAALTATAATLDAAAVAVDSHDGEAGGSGTGEASGRGGSTAAVDWAALAMTARAVAEDAATTVLDRVGRALGPGPLVGNRAHARRVADLTLFLRQSHAEADLADLGRRVATAPG